MNDTIKIPTTYGQVQLDDLIDGEVVTGIRRTVAGNNVITALRFGSQGWTPWTASTRRVSVSR